MATETIIIIVFVGLGMAGILWRFITVRRRKAKEQSDREDLYPMF